MGNFTFRLDYEDDVPSVSPSSSLSDYITKLTFRALDLRCNRNLLRLLILPRSTRLISKFHPFFEQLLDHCTVKLGLTSAARLLYTCSGELITDIQQLIRPYTRNMQQFSIDDAQQTDGVVVDDSRLEMVCSLIVLFAEFAMLKFQSRLK